MTAAARNLDITYAGGIYDRTLPLATGRVQPRGVDLRFLDMPVEDVFWRMMRHQEFDASEISLASFAIAVARGEPQLVAIPVFPSRHFRLSCFYVRDDSPLERLEDLGGRRIGLPEYQMTAAVWVRGMLADEFGVAPGDVRWTTGRPERLDIALPENVALLGEPGSGTEAGHPRGPLGLQQALLDGHLDAIFAARMPPAFAQAQGLRRLLRDSRAAELAYFQKTGLFPIMHAVAIREDLYRSHRWLARSLQDAFQEALAAARHDLYDSTALRVMLPWAVEAQEDTRQLFGPDLWSYGLAANRRNVDTLLRYLHEQGLTERRLAPEELFVPEVREVP